MFRSIVQDENDRKVRKHTGRLWGTSHTCKVAGRDGFGSAPEALVCSETCERRSVRRIVCVSAIEQRVSYL